jgi:hypothetical protein
MFAVATLATLGLATGSAPAQIQVVGEPNGEDCGEVTIDVHAVSGGCHAEFEGNLFLYAHVPSEFLFMGCEVHFGARIGDGGGGYVSAASFFSLPSPSGPCLRAPCEEVDSTMTPWPLQISETGPAQEEIEIRFCVRPVPPASGSNAVCELHLPLVDNGGHSYELGDDTHEYCEGGSSQSSVKVHFATEEPDGERVEIVH